MILFDYQPAIGGRNTGVGIYTHQLYEALQHKLGHQIKPLKRKSPSPIRTVAERILWEQVLLPYSLFRWKPSLFHSPGFALPLAYKGKTLITVHDVSYFHFPAMLRGPLSRFYWFTLCPSTWKRATGILCVSESTRMDLLQTLHLPEEKIFAILSGTPDDIHFVHENHWNPSLLPVFRDYLLYVGTLEERKNLLVLLKAYTLLQTRHISSPLLIVGEDRTLYGKQMKQYAAEHLRSAPIYFLGFVSREHLSEIYSRALLFISPSLSEGFGFCPLEAMKCGIPCVVSRIPAHQEVLQDSAEFFSPDNPEELAFTIEKLLSDTHLRQQYIQKGKKRTEQLTWEKTAEKTIALYFSLLK
ncbi:MAG: glycosyltransferase family 4 protein [bacterium JZ-2024 1]